MKKTLANIFIRDPKLGIFFFLLSLLRSLFLVRNQESEIRNPLCGLRSQRSGIRNLSLPLRVMTWIFIPIMLLTSIPPTAIAAATNSSDLPFNLNQDFKNPAPIRTRKGIKVNRTVPKVKPSSDGLEFPSVWCSDKDIFRAQVFQEPLVPIGRGAILDNVLNTENRTLAETLIKYSKRSAIDDVSVITEFLQKYPNSPWKAALLTNLAIIYRQTGWFSKAIEASEEAWKLSKGATDPRGRTLADRAAGEVVRLYTRFGQQEKLEQFFKENGQRQFAGSADVYISEARAGLNEMKNKPQAAFRCGPFALDKIIYSKNPDKWIANLKIYLSSAAPKGFSLEQLQQLAKDVKMDFQVARRAPGSAVIMPSVIHWKTDHYSALIKKKDNCYLVQDPALGGDMWVSEAVLDAETTGYCLIPSGKLPDGWKKVELSEAKNIWGKGYPPQKDYQANTSKDKQTKKDPCEKGMASYNFLALLAGLRIEDTPVGYTPPRGPAIEFDVVYNQCEDPQFISSNCSNLSSKWTFSWFSYLEEQTGSAGNINLFARGGGEHTYIYESGAYRTQRMTGDKLVRNGVGDYELRHSDGSREIYDHPSSPSYSRKVFLTKIIDSAGNEVNLTYDGCKLMAITDAIGQVTNLYYEDGSDEFRITKVTDPFGRSATFDYDENDRLIKITDVIGIESEFGYEGTSNFINLMTTPYGTTSFAYSETFGEGVSDRWLEATDPLGDKERLEYHYDCSSFMSSEDNNAPSDMLDVILSSYLNGRNSFYWDKHAYKKTSSGEMDYSRAKIYHWLHQDQYHISRYLESEKEPLENRVWYQYPDQTQGGFETNITIAKPYKIARRLTNGGGNPVTQLYQYEYNNSYGKVTKAIDPLNRGITYVYAANDIDLLEVRQTTGSNDEVLGTFGTYNSQHLPPTFTDASGQTTTYTYNSAGQVLEIRNPKSEITKYTYDTDGYLKKIEQTDPTNPSNFVTVREFGYDDFGRVRTVTDSESYTLTVDYDDLDRLTLITYPDGTTEQFDYGNKLDLSLAKDRLGRWSQTLYDVNRHPIVYHDALGRTTSLIWCGCGSLEKIIDPLGHATTWFRDVQGRVTDKVYPDNKAVHYTYDSTINRLHTIIDAKNQITTYEYFKDNDLKKIDYSDANTHDVEFTYDPNYNRVLTMADGTGTTTYAYNPVVAGNVLGKGRLASIDSPLGNDLIAYSYDELGRVTTRSINSVSAGVIYDTLGRVTNATNSLGSFTYNYVNKTERLSSIAYPNGQTTAFQYFNNAGDQRLSEIRNQKSGMDVISKFNYTYDVAGQITSWTQQADAQTPAVYNFQYDAVDQLVSAVRNQGSAIKNFAYSYDKAGNRTSEQIDSQPRKSSYNDVNELTSQQSGGQMRFKGTVNEPSKVTVQGKPANVSTNNVFEARTEVSPGTNVISIVAQDYSGNATTNNFQVVVNDTVGQKTLAYDDNGNLTSDGTRTYDWDAADRLVKITQSSLTSEFTYDGLGRRVRIVEKDGQTVTSDKRFLWVGTEIAEERNSAGDTVLKRFEAQGVEDNGTDYFYTRDHLGSIRELTDGNQTVRARYEYSPYGIRTKVSGDKDVDFLYTGHYYHAPSGLYLTLYRAYDPELGRWLSRDPIGNPAIVLAWIQDEDFFSYGDSLAEALDVLAEYGVVGHDAEFLQGPNLYSYAFGDPINYWDPFGLDTYSVNRKLGGGPSYPRNVWNTLSHTFTFTTNPDGTVAHTYSWGNDANVHSWNKDQPEDICAAKDALKKKNAQREGDSSLDPYVEKAYNKLNKKENQHVNLGVMRNCKSETRKLLKDAKKLQGAGK